MIIEVGSTYLAAEHITLVEDYPDGETTWVSVYSTSGQSETFKNEYRTTFLDQWRFYCAFRNQTFNLQAESLYNHMKMRQQLDQNQLQAATSARGPEKGN